MRRNIMIEISHDLAASIFNGSQTVEFRLELPPEDFAMVYLWDTTLEAVTGRFEPRQIIRNKGVWDIWKMLDHGKEKFGLVEDDYLDYGYRIEEREGENMYMIGTGYMNAITIKASSVVEYDPPKTLEDFGLTNPPNYICFVNKNPVD